MLWSDTGDEEAKENTTLQFNLKVKCIKNKNAPKNATDPDELYIHSKGKFSSAYVTLWFNFMFKVYFSGVQSFAFIAMSKNKENKLNLRTRLNKI